MNLIILIAFLAWVYFYWYRKYGNKTPGQVARENGKRSPLTFWIWW